MENHYDPSEFVKLLYKQRLRTMRDRELVDELYKKVFRSDLLEPAVLFHMNNHSVHIGQASLNRKCVAAEVDGARGLQILQHNMAALETFMKCIDMNWMTMMVGWYSLCRMGWCFCLLI